MTITFDSMALSDDLMLDPPLHAIQKIEADTAWSRGGRQIRWERSRKDAPVDLAGGEDYGWLTAAMLTSLKTKADSLGATYTLSFHGTSMTVRFRHEDAPVIEAEPVQPVRKTDEAATDRFHNVRIKLMWRISA